MPAASNDPRFINLTSHKDYLIIIPLYNEQKNVEDVISKIEEMGYIDKCLFVDDGSKDATPEILKQLAQEKGIGVFLGEQTARKSARSKLSWNLLKIPIICPRRCFCWTVILSS